MTIVDGRSCTLVVAMFADFPPGILPGLVPGMHAKNTLRTWYDILGAVDNVKRVCLERERGTEFGYAALGSELIFLSATFLERWIGVGRGRRRGWFGDFVRVG